MSGIDRRGRLAACVFCWLVAFAAPAPLMAQPASDSAGGAAAKLDEKVWDRLIYLPYKSLNDVIDKHGSTVFMPYEDYLKLWNRDKRQATKQVQAVITSSHYTGRVDKSLLRVEANLTVQVLGDPWVEVPIQFSKAAVGKLTAEANKKVLLKGAGNGSYSLLFGQAGEHKIQLELAAPIQTSPDGRSADFVVPPVGITTFELAIPQKDQTIELKPQLIAMAVNQAADETRVKANLGSTTEISARWHPKTGLKPEMNLLAAVTNNQKITLRDGLVHTDAWLTYTILRGEMDQLSIAVPNGQRILGVSSGNAKIKGWKANKDDERQTVIVDFLNPVKGSVKLEVHTEREFNSDPLELAGRDVDGNYNGIHSLDAVRESGQLSVVAAKDLSLQFEEVKGLARIEAGEVVEVLRQADSAVFKFYSADVRMQVVAKPVEARLLVDSQYNYEFHDDELQLTAQYNYRVERAGVFELTAKVPATLEVSSVTIPSNQAVLREFHVEGDGDNRILRILLRNKTQPNAAFSVVIKAQHKFDEANESVELELPIPQPVIKSGMELNAVERELAQLFVYAPDALEVITDTDGLTSVQPLPVASGRRVGTRRLASAWTFNRRPVTIPLKTVRKPTRLTASVGTTINVKEENVEVNSTVTFNVQFAGLDTFRFSVPEAVSKRIQITSLESGTAPDIKERNEGEAKDGWVTWTVTMQREVLGTHRFQVRWDQKPGGNVAEGDGPDAAVQDEKAANAAQAADGGDGPQTTETVIQTVRILGLEKSDDNPLEVVLADIAGEVVIDKDRSLAVKATRLDDGLEAIDVRELTLLKQTGSLAYRYFRQPVGVKIEATKHEIQKVVETVVMRALVEIVARDHVQASYRSRYLLKSSERQRLRVDLPPGSEILGVFVNGKSVEPEKNTAADISDSYFVNVTRSTNSDQPFSLMIQTVTKISEDSKVAFDGFQGELHLRFPAIGGPESSGVKTQQMQAAIWIPEEYSFINSPDGFTNESALRLEDALAIQRIDHDFADLDSWIQVESAGFIDFPTEGKRVRFSNLGGTNAELQLKWASQSGYTWLVSGLMIVLAFVLRREAWDNKILMILVTGLVAAMFGLSSPIWTAEIVHAARFGLFALVGIWILTSVGSWKSAVPAVSNDETPTPALVGNQSIVIPPPGVFDDFRADWDKS